MSSHVIGTAGHIDHGKSTLVKALTGINPDRLKEEKEREMTIDLGFAYLDLPSGKRVGIVDVPGHERFIRNMLAGASGIDLVLFVVAADEGMMPQSREHLDILNLLKVKKGVIVLTKIDLVDKDWLFLIEEELKEEVKGTFLEGAPIFKVSSLTGQGLDQLVKYIDQTIESIEKRPVDLPARYPIDRVFKVAGFGTVVTGTLWEGKIRVGQNLKLLPQDIDVKVRNLQSHGESVEVAEAAVRLAINISGAEKVSIKRGDVLVEPGCFRPTNLIDAELELLDSAHPIEHAEKIHFYLGTKETLGKIRILFKEKMEPGEKGFVQIVLEEPVVARRGDRFIIRRFSPVVTIGGGTVLEPYAQRKRLRDKKFLSEFELKKQGNLREILNFYLEDASSNGLSLDELKLRLAETGEIVEKQVAGMISEGRVVKVSDRYYSKNSLIELKEKALNEVKKFFSENPHLPSMDREALRSKLEIRDRRIFSLILDELNKENSLLVSSDSISLPDRSAQLSPAEREVKEAIEKIFLESEFNPPSPDNIVLNFEGREKIAKRMFDVLVREGKLIKIAPDFYMHEQALSKAKEELRKAFLERKKLRVSEIRDILRTSRKYAVPLAEYLDKIRFTRRVGDERILMEGKD
ncbi:MAG: selenocysteine-specific translation elongation factor [Actinobacteria bacterium]|nr:selenocysteine-specific translation elongation factor [Actinomycetota bacterium]